MCVQVHEYIGEDLDILAFQHERDAVLQPIVGVLYLGSTSVNILIVSAFSYNTDAIRVHIVRLPWAVTDAAAAGPVLRCPFSI